ncbi:magnesium/cobalt transporter CorA [Bacillus aerolatus]|uniref:Magnesium transport protein CorA n=1 Tax=Bacillus aerolatus TaxID=2653354 RepID=A0A6I1FHN3_9BACI|nr:magnesium/cobalt transporter CorA [Bacillus aerolatus]KAB7707890.1 magnesium/cobalt transporter CorA [Bacillus aerolatus]
MIKTCVLTTNGELVFDIQLEEIKEKDIVWRWVDFFDPNEEEAWQLKHFFNFHPLAVEDCLDNQSGRPKLDFYENYAFFLIHALDQDRLEGKEAGVFINSEMIVTVHKQPIQELNDVWENVVDDTFLQKGPVSILHRLIDRFVDEYFPEVYRIEDLLNNVDEEVDTNPGSDLIDRLFNIRHDISKLRRSIFPMKDLVYRLLNSTRLDYMKDQHIYFRDVYDHLMKLAEMLESYREFSSDIRDSYLSVNSDKMNNIMMTLTIITTIFMPLTFIAGVYGMNFRYMPELETRYGYFIVIAVMAVISILMFSLFVRAGWLQLRKKKKQPRP